MDVKKKLGPLPVWAWGALIGVSVLLYMRYRSAASTATSSTTGTSVGYDPNAIDPATGISYGEEESAALNATAGNATSSGSLDNSTPPAETFAQQLQDFVNEAAAMGWTAPGTVTAVTQPAVGPAGPAGPAGADAPAAPVAATSVPPATATVVAPAAAAPVATAPQVNKPAAPPNVPVYSAKQIAADLLSSAGIGPQEGSASFIQGLAQQGFKAGKGAASGTYTKAGSSLKYFVFQLGGETHVRQAK